MSESSKYSLFLFLSINTYSCILKLAVWFGASFTSHLIVVEGSTKLVPTQQCLPHFLLQVSGCIIVLSLGNLWRKPAKHAAVSDEKHPLYPL